MAMTRNAPTVCSAATVQALSLPFDQENTQRHEADEGQLDDVRGRDREDIAQNDRLNVDGGRRQRHHEQAKPEEGGEDQPDDGVFLQPGALVEKQHRGARKAPRKERTWR